MTMEKTIEDKWQSVKEFILAKIRNADFISWESPHGVWEAHWYKPNWKLTIKLQGKEPARLINCDLLMEQGAESQPMNVHTLYVLLGLSERDAVQSAKDEWKESTAKAIAQLNLETATANRDKLEAEKRNAALVAALGSIKAEFERLKANAKSLRDVVYLDGVLAVIEAMSGEALAANEKGGNDEN